MLKSPDKIKLFFSSLIFRAGELARGLKEKPMTADAKAAEPGKIYSFEAATIDGKPKKLADYKGRALLIVNTASLCGFTPQYDRLEELQQRYKAQGLSVLAFPANEFGEQEPGTDAEIKEFCRARYRVSFDLFSKIKVKGPGIHPLYRFLTTESGFPGDIPWNFAKFLAGRDGRIAARFSPADDPMSGPVTRKVEELLGS